jgi:hypothetical protein
VSTEPWTKLPMRMCPHATTGGTIVGAVIYKGGFLKGSTMHDEGRRDPRHGT